MCGLVGVAGDIRGPEKKMFRDLLIFNQVRGFDSAGVVIVPTVVTPKQDPFTIVKDVGPAQNLWEFDKDKIFDYRGGILQSAKVLIGHNRAATLGKVNVDNAHPFEFGHIAGAHNGSLNLWCDLEDADKFDVDSKAIFRDIEVNGIDNTWKSFYGAAALSFWDEKAQTLNFIRNDQRPLYFAWSKDKKTLFWASEWEMIWLAARRNKVTLHTEEGQTSPLFKMVREDTLFSFKPLPLSCELVEERKLEKKSFRVPKKWNGTPTKAGFKGGHTGTKQLKTGWKKNTKRSNVSLVDATLTDFRETMICGIHPKEDYTVFRASLRIKDKYMGVLNIYPTNTAELKAFSEAADAELKGHMHRLKLLGKPRVSELPQSHGIRSYHCAANLIRIEAIQPTKKFQVVASSTEEEIRNFVNHNGNLVTESELAQQLRAVGDCCAYCSDSILTSDHTEISWSDSITPLCKKCTEDFNGYEHLLKGTLQ